MKITTLSGEVPELSPGTCRSCGAPIYWVKTHNEKNMPLDRGGTNRVVLLPGGARVVKAYKSHWESCPYAKKHRKAKPTLKAVG